MGQQTTEHCSKVRATTSIWGCATGMLALCIPISPNRGVELTLES